MRSQTKRKGRRKALNFSQTTPNCPWWGQWIPTHRSPVTKQVYTLILPLGLRRGCSTLQAGGWEEDPLLRCSEPSPDVRQLPAEIWASQESWEAHWGAMHFLQVKAERPAEPGAGEWEGPLPPRPRPLKAGAGQRSWKKSLQGTRDIHCEQESGLQKAEAGWRGSTQNAESQKWDWRPKRAPLNPPTAPPGLEQRTMACGGKAGGWL